MSDIIVVAKNARMPKQWRKDNKHDKDTFFCDGVHDEIELQAGIDRAAELSTQVILCGTLNIAGTIRGHGTGTMA